MKKDYFIEEDLNEFAKRGRRKLSKPIEPIANIDDDLEMEDDVEDNWYKADEEDDYMEAEPEQIEDVSLEDETANVALMNQFRKMIDNELKLPEFSRGTVEFKLKPTKEIIKGVPLTKLANGQAVLFKTPSGMKKVKMEDILLEGLQRKEKTIITFVSESFKDYE